MWPIVIHFIVHCAVIKRVLSPSANFFFGSFTNSLSDTQRISVQVERFNSCRLLHICHSHQCWMFLSVYMVVQMLKNAPSVLVREKKTNVQGFVPKLIGFFLCQCPVPPPFFSRNTSSHLCVFPTHKRKNCSLVCHVQTLLVGSL